MGSGDDELIIEDIVDTFDDLKTSSIYNTYLHDKNNN